jgi:predicted  nucleic acid-binding Zn-ribbon protein
MATVTENDLKEIKDLITAQSVQMANMQSQFMDFQTQITDLKVSVGKIEATLQTQQLYLEKVPDLVEKVGELKNWKQVGLIVVTAMINSVVSGTFPRII